MSIDDILLIGRIAFVAALYVFLLVLAVLLKRELGASAAGANERAPADLLIVEPGETDLQPGDRLPLLARTTVGRTDENDIVLVDTFVSSEHARLAWNGRGWALEDLGSTNGTRVNGKQIKKRVAIRVGDVLEFGRIKVKLVTV